MFKRSLILALVTITTALTACSIVYVSGDSNRVGTDTKDMVNTGLKTDIESDLEEKSDPPPEN